MTVEEELLPTPAARREANCPAPRRAHLVGIAGAGMRALADVLLGRGWQLSGSDLAIDPVGHLARAGVRLHRGHSAVHLPPHAHLVVYSRAVPPSNPELRRAAELGIRAYSCFEMLGRLSSGSHTVAVAGTHGKSTTTAMAAEVLIRAGRDPTVFYGALPLVGHEDAPPNGRLGQSSGGRAGRSELVLVEACEYRGNFLHLRPRHAVILGIEPDHFDCYGSAEELEEAYARFAGLLPADGLLLARHDCPASRRIGAKLACRVETLGIDARADWSARRLFARRGRYAFEVCRRGGRLCQVSLRFPGRHNVLNALAAAALAWENGVSPERIALALGRFRGLRRRLERLGAWRGVTLVDDYAHHPTEVTATLGTIRRMFPGRRVWCVYQPHQVSRTEHLLDELAESLQNADRVLVAEIFRAREGPPRNGEVTAADLARRVREISAEPPKRPPRAALEVPEFHDTEEITRLLQTRLGPGDVLVTMGAGDIRRICDGLINGFREDRSAG
jgi:UDP-N-acetylmuramate--alanine ligase